MHFELSIAKRKRSCGLCGMEIMPKAKHFVQIDYPEDSTYPLKKNVCFPCASSLTQPDFIDYLEKLLSRLKNLKGRISGMENKTLSSTNTEVPF